jgi:hypothetical protein
MSLPVDIQVNLEGLEGVTAGFSRIGESATNMGNTTVTATSHMTAQMDLLGNEIKESSNQMSMSYRMVAGNIAMLTMNTMQLGDIMERMSKGQMDVGRGMMMLAVNAIQLSANLFMLNKAYQEGITHQIVSLGLRAKEIAASIAHALVIGAETLAHWVLVAAKKALSIASAISHALEGPWGWAILAGAAVAAGFGLALASQIPSKQFGGSIERTGPYLLHAGEYVVPRSASSGPVFNIANLTVVASSPQDFVDKMRRLRIT